MTAPIHKDMRLPHRAWRALGKGNQEAIVNMLKEGVSFDEIQGKFRVSKETLRRINWTLVTKHKINRERNLPNRSFCMDDETWLAMKEVAKRKKISVSELMRTYCEWGLEVDAN